MLKKASVSIDSYVLHLVFLKMQMKVQGERKWIRERRKIEMQ